MIVLDTNIASVMAVVDHQDRPIIESWRAAVTDRDLRLTTITQTELLYGLELLPYGAKRAHLAQGIHAILQRMGDLILSFDSRAAELCASIMATRRRVGRPIGSFDAQIAAIAKANRAAIATRNTSDFDGCGVELVNPYD